MAAQGSCTCISLLVVPTERTDYTEVYGLKLLEYTERIDAARHTTEGTELIAYVTSPRLSMVALYGGARFLFLYLLACSSHRTQPASNHFCGFLTREA